MTKKIKLILYRRNKKTHHPPDLKLYTFGCKASRSINVWILKTCSFSYLGSITNTMKRSYSSETFKTSNSFMHDTSKSGTSSVPRLRSHSTPATLCWLEKNYELSEGVCIPRNVVYYNYVDWCGKNGMQPVNAASFGKVSYWNNAETTKIEPIFPR